ncbi:hypothetical protein E2C01_021250 [Portunus trituberculatus]|uniref:Uncharacterized protein n=1 Tax=Portunus trituberculatus TaxID=210409 RepID=A0A5B7E4G7_PORTR|nr:hypothetical protein [Portunus trituberculatus]
MEQKGSGRISGLKEGVPLLASTLCHLLRHLLHPQVNRRGNQTTALVSLGDDDPRSSSPPGRDLSPLSLRQHLRPSWQPALSLSLLSFSTSSTTTTSTSSSSSSSSS